MRESPPPESIAGNKRKVDSDDGDKIGTGPVCVEKHGKSSWHIVRVDEKSSNHRRYPVENETQRKKSYMVDSDLAVIDTVDAGIGGRDQERQCQKEPVGHWIWNRSTK